MKITGTAQQKAAKIHQIQDYPVDFSWCERSRAFKAVGPGKLGVVEGDVFVEIMPSEFLAMLISFAKNQDNIAVRAQILSMATYINTILESEPIPCPEPENNQEASGEDA